MGRWLFRLRYLLHGVVYALGFVIPWNRWLHLEPVRSAWVYLAYAMQRQGWANFFTASTILLVAGTLFALLGALIRTWGAAYLGASTVHSSAMHGDTVLADGPYRYLRNPLYVGTVLHTLALGLVMELPGLIFCIVTIIVLQAGLIASEEHFLEAKLGAPYLTYCGRVPRVIPALTPRVPASGVPAHWGMAFIGEIYFWGVAIVFASVGWKFNGQLMLQGVLISFGVSIIARALLPQRTA